MLPDLKKYLLILAYRLAASENRGDKQKNSFIKFFYFFFYTTLQLL